MNCPSCASDQTQIFSAIFEGGTSIVESKAGGGGLAITAGGIAPVIGGGSSRGVQQTVLGAKASPPEKQPVAKCIIFAIFVGPFLSMFVWFGFVVVQAVLNATSGFWEDLPGYAFSTSWFCLSALMIVSAVVNFRFNRDEWPTLHEEWLQKWYCHKCGSEFVPQSISKAA